MIYNDGLNLYAYCNSNPVMYSDPSGFAKQCDPKVGGEKDSKEVLLLETTKPITGKTNDHHIIPAFRGNAYELYSW